MTLDRARLEGMNVNGLDFVLLLMNLTIELVAAMSPSAQVTDDRLVDLANKLDGFARKITEPRTKLLTTQLAVALMSTERGAA